MSTTAIHRNALATGAMLLEYKLEAVLGVGGFGMTYLARDIKDRKSTRLNSSH